MTANGYVAHGIPRRLPGRVDSAETTFASVDDVAQALTRAATANGEHEKRNDGEYDAPARTRVALLARAANAVRFQTGRRGTLRLMVKNLLDAIEAVPTALAYAIIALLVFGEAAFFAGFVVPGETAVLLGGFLASQGDLDIVPLIVVVVVSAILGDTVGYEVGKHLGPRVLKLRIFRQHQARLDTAQGMLRRRGGPAVFLGRWTAFFRAVMPGIAGLSRLRYPVFLFWNALGGIAWGVTFSLVGYFAGASYEKVASIIGEGAAVVFAVLAIAGIAVWAVKRRRRGQIDLPADVTTPGDSLGHTSEGE